MKKKRGWLWCWGGLFFLFVLPAGSLPAAEGTAQLSFRKTALPAKTYQVKKGDTIARIVRRLGPAAPRLDVIRRLNPQILDLNKIYPGQKLVLVEQGEQKAAGESPALARNYTVKKGDSLTRIILYELQAPPEEVATLVRLLQRLNPEVDNLNRIYPGQVLKLPGGGKGVEESREPPVVPAAAPPAEEKQAPAATSPLLGNRLSVIAQIVKKLNGLVLTSGKYYIPLPEAGQVTVDCATVPVVELDDGTTALLDFTGRLPGALAQLIRANWQNYQVVKIEKNEDAPAVLKKIMAGASSYRMTKVEKPIFLEGEPQLRMWPDWLIEKKATAGKEVWQLGLFWPSDAGQLLPPVVHVQARKKGLQICEILGDKLQERVPERPADGTPLAIPRITGRNDEEFLQNCFMFLGLETVRDRDVKIFDAAKDGMNLSIKADWLVKKGTRTALLHKSRLPQQFLDVLRSKGMEPCYLAPGMSKKSLLENVLPALGMPVQFAFFSLPGEEKKAKFAVSFAALKVGQGEGAFYWLDFDVDRDSYELLTGYGKLQLVRY